MRISITTKLIIFVLILSLLSTFVIGKYSFEKAKAALVDRTFDQLISLRIEKTNRIQNLFLQCQNDISNISRSDDTKEIIQLLGQDVHHDSTKVINKLKPIFTNYLKAYLEASKFYSNVIFISGSKALFVGVKETSEFNLDSSANEIIGELAVDGKLQSKIIIRDIENFRKNVDPIIAISMKVEDSSKVYDGAVILELPIKVINDIMLEKSSYNGLGQTGETYLVGSDYLMRSTSRFQDNSVYKTKVMTKGVINVFNDSTGKDEIIDYRGVPVLSSFGSVKIPGLNWAILAEIDVKEAMISIDSIKNNIIYLTVIIFLLLSGVVALLTSMITAPIKSLISKTDKVAEGEYGGTLNYTANDEVGDLVNAFNKMTLQLKSQSEKLESERMLRLNSLIDGQELERRRLSKELHDGLGQLILAIKIKFQRALIEKPDKAKQIIKETEDLFKKTMIEVRNISNGLMPAVLTEFGLSTAIKNLGQDLNENTGIQINIETAIQSGKLDAKFETYLYRIIQEALNNVIKHAEATEVDIVLIEKNDELVLSIKDNGRGMQTYHNHIGNGLNNMKDRATLLSGKLDIISEGGQGTEVRLIVKNIHCDKN